MRHVSVELTGQMLATLFDIPLEDRQKLIYWSDATSNLGNPEYFESVEEGFKVLWECAAYFMALFEQRKNEPPKSDLISVLAHGEATKNMPPNEFLGNILLLIVGGNDTTRNSISGGLLALNQHPAEYAKLRANPSLIQNMVPEIIRWQSPVAHMARTALVDTEIGGKQIKAGERVAMWYISGNRDEEAIPDAGKFTIDRAERTASPFVRLRHSPLPRQSARRVATPRDLGRTDEALSEDRCRRQSEIPEVELHPRHTRTAGEDSRLIR